MKKLLFISGILVLAAMFIPACEVENCPPNAIAYAHFALVDQHGRQFKTSDTISIIGQTYADVVVYDTLADGTIQERTVHDSLVSDVFINQETAASSFKLPLSYNTQTRFVIFYRSLEKMNAGTDTVNIEHRNIPYFTNMDCGTMMFYNVTNATSTHHRLDSLVITNPNIDNNEKENFKIYFTVTAADE